MGVGGTGSALTPLAARILWQGQHMTQVDLHHQTTTSKRVDKRNKNPPWSSGRAVDFEAEGRMVSLTQS